MMQQKEEGSEKNIVSSIKNNSRLQIWLAVLHGHHFLCRSSLATFFLIILSFGAYISTRLFVSSLIAGNASPESKLTVFNYRNEPIDHEKLSKKKEEIVIPLNCSLGNIPNKCPADYYPTNFTTFSGSDPPPGKCPDYFRWIHEDLWPWRETGITEKMVLSAKRTAAFRLIILDGKAYLETYVKAFQCRDVFTLWGILQLLRRYPGRVPDLDLMFDCDDWPVINKNLFYRKPNGDAPPPLFGFCGDDKSFDIVFPDWSFWGWPEINIKPWEQLSRDLKDGNQRIKWVERDPFAYWKGNPEVAEKRKDLIKCNVSDQNDWNARVYAQNWLQEHEQGYKQSDLSRQCNHRFKIYIEGTAWSVSEKYIVACNSMTLLVNPDYYDFFTRSLIPLQHYWPIRDEDKCRSIKHAVDWGNSHQEQAQAIGNAGSRFIEEKLKMDYVYDYMFHLLNQYSKLLTYKPIIPPGATEFCSESMACLEQDPIYKKFMFESLAKGPKDESPCEIPPPYDPATLLSVLQMKNSAMKKVETWENEFWDNNNNNTNNNNNKV